MNYPTPSNIQNVYKCQTSKCQTKAELLSFKASNWRKPTEHRQRDCERYHYEYTIAAQFFNGLDKITHQSCACKWQCKSNIFFFSFSFFSFFISDFYILGVNNCEV